MKNFECTCGQHLFFENTVCTRCNKQLGYDPLNAKLLALEPAPDPDIRNTADGSQYRLCGNYSIYNVCNWLLPAESPDTFCMACGLNQVIPSLAAPENRRWWANMEAAKRRLIYTLLQLKLPVQNKHQNSGYGLAFAFLEDKRSNPNAKDEHILTGHTSGLITVNLTEANDVTREWMRESMGEAYRTLLGHFRHESGHYYFDMLITNRGQTNSFRKLFGDERQNYDAALSAYHSGTLTSQSPDLYISNYAQAHPLEDWAECWAHYLHMIDTLETATQYGMTEKTALTGDFSGCIDAWMQLTLALNSLNRSMGLKDAYPFVISPAVYEKLNFVHAALYPR
jgi:hypothetical protein